MHFSAWRVWMETVSYICHVTDYITLETKTRNGTILNSLLSCFAPKFMGQLINGSGIDVAYTWMRAEAFGWAKLLKNASTGIPQEPKQREEVLYLLLGNRVRSDCVCWRSVWECINCHFIWWWGNAQSGRRIKRTREENNLDSDYNQAWCRKKETSP